MKNALCNLRSSQSILSIKNIKADKNRLANLSPPDESLSVVFENLHKLKNHIVNAENQVGNFTDATLMQAASAIIWLQSTYDLNILQMTEGKLISNNDEAKGVSKPITSESFYFEDLFLISRAALEIELYAIALKFLVSSVISHQQNKCTLKTSDGMCRKYNFQSVQTRYVGKHNYAILNNSDINFDSAERFPFRITNG